MVMHWCMEQATEPNAAQCNHSNSLVQPYSCTSCVATQTMQLQTNKSCSALDQLTCTGLYPAGASTCYKASWPVQTKWRSYLPIEVIRLHPQGPYTTENITWRSCDGWQNWCRRGWKQFSQTTHRPHIDLEKIHRCLSYLALSYRTCCSLIL